MDAVSCVTPLFVSLCGASFSCPCYLPPPLWICRYRSRRPLGGARFVLNELTNSAFMTTPARLYTALQHLCECLLRTREAPQLIRFILAPRPVADPTTALWFAFYKQPSLVQSCSVLPEMSPMSSYVLAKNDGEMILRFSQCIACVLDTSIRHLPDVSLLMNAIQTGVICDGPSMILACVPARRFMLPLTITKVHIRAETVHTAMCFSRDLALPVHIFIRAQTKFVWKLPTLAKTYDATYRSHIQSVSSTMTLSCTPHESLRHLLDAYTTNFRPHHGLFMSPISAHPLHQQRVVVILTALRTHKYFCRNTCAWCQNVATKARICSACHRVSYCSIVCQRSHVVHHRPMCQVQQQQLTTGTLPYSPSLWLAQQGD
jgi:hypothetical protein